MGRMEFRGLKRARPKILRRSIIKFMKDAVARRDSQMDRMVGDFVKEMGLGLEGGRAKAIMVVVLVLKGQAVVLSIVLPQ